MNRTSTVFAGLDERQTAYVLARSNAISNAEALRVCGFSKGWLNNRDIEDLNERADILRKDKAIRAVMLLEDAIEEAAKVKIAGLRVRDDRVKQAVATEIIERGLGKIPVKSEITGADGDALEIIVRYAETNRTDSA